MAQSTDIVFATYTYSTNDRLQNLEPLTAHLSETTGLNIRAVSYPTVQALVESIRLGEVDFAMMNTSGYLVLQRNHPGIASPMVNLSLGNETTTNYGGCLIAQKSLDIWWIDDLAERADRLPMALVTSSSTSGNLVPRLLLNSKNIPDAESKFEVSYVGTHLAVVEHVLSGKAAIGGCGCAEVESAQKSMNLDDEAIVIGVFDNIPLGPVIAHSKTDPAIVSKVAAILENLHSDNAPVFTKFLGGWSEFKEAKQFVRVSDSDYNPFRLMFGTNTTLWRLIE